MAVSDNFVTSLKEDLGGVGRTTETIKGVNDSLNTHKSSSDHDGRYYTESEVGTLFTNHGSSGDHDGRYYTETELNVLLGNVASPKVKFTAEGGLAVKLTNKTGVNSVKGSVVSCNSGADNSFVLQSSEYDAFGVVYESGIADAAECWVVVSGIAEILLKDTTASTRGHVVFSADTDGRAITGAVPTPPNDDGHFKEIGHCLETKTSGTDVLFKAVIHFN